jgi:hypothetical protein
MTVAACETPQQKIASKENMLTAAGFKLRPINTPQRQAALQQLPPHKFSRKVNDGRVFYVYPDPTVCGCLYVGDQTAYTTYRNNVFQKNLADERARPPTRCRWTTGIGVRGADRHMAGITRTRRTGGSMASAREAFRAAGVSPTRTRRRRA